MGDEDVLEEGQLVGQALDLALQALVLLLQDGDAVVGLGDFGLGLGSGPLDRVVVPSSFVQVILFALHPTAVVG